MTEYFPGDDRNEAAKDSAASEENLEGKTQMTVEEALQEMTLREKVLQLFMVTPEALTGVDEVYAAGAKTEESIREYPVGGIIYFKQNLRSPDQVKDMLTRTQKYFRDNTGIEAFLAVDEEGGQVSRISGRISGREEFGIASFPDMSEIGASGEPQKAYEVGDKIGTYLADQSGEYRCGQAFLRNRRSCDGSIFQRSGQGTAGSWHKRCPEALSGAWRHNGGQP